MSVFLIFVPAVLMLFAVVLLTVILIKKQQKNGGLPPLGQNNAPIKAERLRTIHRSGGGQYGHRREILEDAHTGVQYLVITSYYGISVTPLLERDGRPFTKL